MKRRDARELAFTLIFEQSFTDDPMEGLLAAAETHREIEPDTYVRTLCLYTAEHRDEIDAKITKHATRWGLGRLPRVTLALLRMCIAEMDFMEDVPVSVSINEAVELCKQYAGEEDASFLNGVLGAYARGEQVSVELPAAERRDIGPGDEITFEEDEATGEEEV